MAASKRSRIDGAAAVTLSFEGVLTPDSFLNRLEQAVAILSAKRRAVDAGVILATETALYEWTVEAVNTDPGRPRVRAHLRAPKLDLPRMLHLDVASLALISRSTGAATPCLMCGRPATSGDNYTVHLTPDGTAGPTSCRAASVLWPDGDDDELADRFRAQC